MKGLVIQLLNHLSEQECPEEEAAAIASRMNLSQLNILSEQSLYKKRKARSDFKEQLKDEEEQEELTMDQVLGLNRVKSRYTRAEIESFIDEHMKDGRMKVGTDTVSSDEDFEKLILAYDYSTRRKSGYQVEDMDPVMIQNGRYTYPGFVFVRRTT